MNLNKENKIVDLTKISKKYPEMWVALSQTSHVAKGVGKTLREAVKKAEANGEKDGIFFKVPPKNTAYVF